MSYQRNGIIQNNDAAGNYLLKFENIHQDHLYYVENDLSFYEKVSVGFLLYGYEPSSATLILQKLLALKNDHNGVSSILFDYSRLNPLKWKHCLTEALAIVKCNHILKRLGHNVADLKICLTPHIAETSIYIHPILKALYAICEKLIPSEAENIVNDVTKDFNDNQKLPFYNYEFLEIYILHWMTLKLIDIGKWNGYNDTKLNNSNAINISLITEQLKIYGHESLKDMLNCVIELFNVNFEEIYNKQCLETKTNPIATTSHQHQREKDSAAVNGTYDSFISNNSSINSINNKNSSVEQYLVRKEVAGFILIFNQKEFYRDPNQSLQHLLPAELLLDRFGTDEDVEALKKSFKSLGYIPDVRVNSTHIEMESIIIEVCKKSIAFDSIFICVLSHGFEGNVYGCNSIPMKVQRINDILANSNCLLNKPKIIIIQACQGNELQKAKIITYLEHDGPSKRLSSCGHFDILTAVSTIPRFASIRHIKEGSWFLQSICKNINELSDSRHILDIMTAVVNDISKKRMNGTECMVPSVTQQLRKFFYFPHRN